MEQNYKEIAKIINTFSWYNCEYLKNKLCDKLADYFERGDKKEYFKTHNPKDDIYLRYNFNRQQFLKDCGVK